MEGFGAERDIAVRQELAILRDLVVIDLVFLDLSGEDLFVELPATHQATQVE